MKDGLFEKNRLETFSDSVIAIIITITIVQLRPPAGTEFANLLLRVPAFLIYLLSFVFLAIYWNNHHHLLKAAKGVNGAIMWSNMSLLFCLTLIPFATSWSGDHLTAAIPTAVYGTVMLASGLCYYVLQTNILKTLGKNSAFARAIGADYKGKLTPLVYVLAIALAFVNPIFSQILIVIVALIWIIPDKRIERALYK